MTKSTRQLRQLFDWSAACWAAAISGTLLLVLMLFALPWFLGGNSWVVVRLLASLVLGPEVLAPPATFDMMALVVGVATHYVMSMGLAIMLAIMIHRWGMIVGVVGGGVFGLAVYAINIYTFTVFFPWYFTLAGVEFAIVNIIFGASAGGIYEWLEVEEFEAL